MGPNALTSKSSRRDERVVDNTGWKDVPDPAFAMIVSILVMPCAERLAIREFAEVSEALERVRTTSWLPSATGSDLSSFLGVVSDRIVPTTVVFGRRRREETIPRPIPRESQEHGT